MTERCGSFPFRYIAEDYSLPYGAVLNYVEAMIASRKGEIWNQHQRIAVDIVYSKLTRIYDRRRFNGAITQQIGAYPWPVNADGVRLRPTQSPDSGEPMCKGDARLGTNCGWCVRCIENAQINRSGMVAQL